MPTTTPLTIGVSGRSWLLNPFINELRRRYGDAVRVRDRTPRCQRVRAVQRVRGVREPRPDEVLIRFRDRMTVGGRDAIAEVDIEGVERSSTLTVTYDAWAPEPFRDPTLAIVRELIEVTR